MGMAPVITADAAKDGVERRPVTTAAAHRPLIAVEPPMEGRDVEALQRAAAAVLAPYAFAVPDHGRFTLATAHACVHAQYVLGLLPDTYQAFDVYAHRMVTTVAQRIIRAPQTRNADQLERAGERQGQLSLGPDFYAGLRHELGMAGTGVEAALAYAARQVGVRVSTGGSTPKVDRWCRAAGYRAPVPWAGAFVAACLLAGGLRTGAGWIGYPSAMLARAEAGEDGWSVHTDGRRGDIACFDPEVDGDQVIHVELVRERLAHTRYSTFGGNAGTSDGNPADGGGVVRRDDRWVEGPHRIVAFARPPW